MTICCSIRSSDPFVRFKKSIVYDSKLSLKAKGLLSIAFSRPETWSYYKSEMMKHCSDGEHSFDSGIKELEEAKYLYRVQKQDKKTGRLCGWKWYFFEQPLSEEEFKKFLRNGGFPGIGETPTSGKTPPNKNEGIKEIEKNNNKETEPPVVVVPSCLDDLKISTSRKEKAAEKFSAEDCERLVQRVKAWNGKKNDTHGFDTIFKNWGVWSDDLNQDDIRLQNEKFLDSIAFNDGKMINGHKITIGKRQNGQYIEFVCGNFVKEFLTSDRQFENDLRDFVLDRFGFSL